METATAIRDIFLSDLEFSKSYLSLHYPFSEQQVRRYGEYLSWGEAHYSVFMNDTDTIHTPQYGLCFNGNLHWTDTLKQSWRLGIWNPFHGCFEGMGGLPVKHDEMAQNEPLYDLIPLDIHKELSIRMACISERANSAGQASAQKEVPAFLDEEVLRNRIYDTLNEADFIALYQRKKEVVLYSDSIWESTLSRVITENFMHEIMQVITVIHELMLMDTETNPPTEGYIHPAVPYDMPLIIDDEVKDDEDDDNDGNDYNNGYGARNQYGKHGGENDWTDDEIDEAFDGNPEATWNVD